MKFKTNINPEIDNYLEAFGTFGAYKSEPDDPAPAEVKGRTLKLRDYDYKAKARHDKKEKIKLKKAKDARIWGAEIVPSEDNSIRYWQAKNGVIAKVTERKDSIRVRKAIGAAREKLREYA